MTTSPVQPPQLGLNIDGRAHPVAKKAKPAPPVRCNGCENTWTGALPCHCGACHRTFTGIRAFDIHRTGGICNEPSQVLGKKGEHRLVPVVRATWSGWGEPGDDIRWSE